MTSIFHKAAKIGRPFYDFNFRMWRDYPIHYLSVLCLVPATYLFVKDADSRYMEAENLAGPPIYRVPRRELVPTVEELEQKYGKV